FLLPTTITIGAWSLIQFIIVFKLNHFQRTINLHRQISANTSFLEVLLTLLLMDIPFLIFRLVVIFYFKCVDNSITFFALKNILMISMEFYRLYAVQIELSGSEMQLRTYR
ncbi:unnamed protein product, partial [Meganyctiphanes norvegica]